MAENQTDPNEPDVPDDECLEPACPYCEVTGDCPHLVAFMDRSFLSIEGGYLYGSLDEVIDPLAKGIRGILERPDDPVETDWRKLDELIAEAHSQYDPNAIGKDFDFAGLVDYHILFDIIRDYFMDNGEVEYYSPEGPPGFTSAYYVIFAEDPEDAVSDMVSTIESHFRVMGAKL